MSQDTTKKRCRPKNGISFSFLQSDAKCVIFKGKMNKNNLSLEELADFKSFLQRKTNDCVLIDRIPLQKLKRMAKKLGFGRGNFKKPWIPLDDELIRQSFYFRQQEEIGVNYAYYKLNLLGREISEIRTREEFLGLTNTTEVASR